MLSVHQPALDMGSAAATLLLDVIAAGGAKSDIKRIKLKPELVVRRSTLGEHVDDTGSPHST